MTPNVVVDPATQTLLPLVVTYQTGLLTLANDAGLTVDVQNLDLPLSSSRVSAHLAVDGTAAAGAVLSGSTICGQIPTYGPFLEQLGFCNPQDDALTVLGGSDFGPYAAGPAMPPAGVGTVTFAATTDAVTATLAGSTLLVSEHVASVLLVDATSGNPVALSYGPTTQHTPSSGPFATVTVPITGITVPPQVRAYLMIDTYPAAMDTLTIP